MKLFIAILLALLMAAQARATQYFVDYSTGSDSAAGTSTSVPWKHCPGDPSATSTASSTSLSAGDTVFFKGGVSYVLTAVNSSPPAVNNVVVNGPQTATNVNWLVGTSVAGIALSWNGTLGSPITYDGNSSGAWGAGRAMITDNFSTNNLEAFLSTGNISNISFLSLVFTNIGGSNIFPNTSFAPVSSDGFPPKPGGGMLALGAANVIISNCYFGHLGYWQTGITNIGNSSLAGGGFHFSGVTNLQVLNCEFEKARDPIFLDNGNAFNVTISNCFFHDNMEWALTCTTSASNEYRSNFTVVSCLFSNWDQYYSEQWTSQIIPSVFSSFPFSFLSAGPHQNGIQMFNQQDASGNYGLPRSPGDTNVYIYNNTFVRTLTHSGGTACIQLQESTTADIYNNVFILPNTGNGVIDILEPCTNASFHIGIYNNSFFSEVISVQISGDTPAGIEQWPTTLTGRIINVKNNVISTINKPNFNATDVSINCTTNLINVSIFGSIFYDYNAFYCDQLVQNTTNAVVQFWTSYFSPGNSKDFTISDTFNNWGWNGNSLQVPVPPYAYTNWVADPALVDLHLVSGSGPIATGVNLTSLGLPGLTVDRDGNARSSTGTWTMGAYGVGSVSLPIVPVWCCR